MKNSYYNITDKSNLSHFDQRPNFSDSKFIGTVQVEDLESGKSRICDVYGFGDVQDIDGLTISIISGQMSTDYRIKSQYIEEYSITFIYDVLGNKQFANDMVEEINEMRLLLLSLKITA